jgi:ABC-type cobalamin/Fe3+-siderophores transport system ATPase subunit
MLPSAPKRYDAFLSYNSQDRLAVHEVAERLKAKRLELYLEVWELAPGRAFQPALAEAMHHSKTCVVFLGPNGLGPWQHEEVQVAIDKRARGEEFRVIPVLLPGTERPRRGDVAHLEFLINASWVEFPKTLDDERAFQSLVWGIAGTKPPEQDGRYEGVCPYRGLEAFRPEDAKFFFGREHLTGWLVSALRREVRAAQGVRFLGVLGPAGSGKSSVVMAGLIPKLRAGGIEGSDRWLFAILRPGDDPLKTLAAEVVSRFLPVGALPHVDEVRKLLNNLRVEAQALDLFAQIALRDQPGDVRLAVVVDEFEEVFTYRPKDDPARARFEQDRDRFFANLLHAAARTGGRVAVVVTMRSDFLSASAMFPQLAAVLSAHQELVGPMTAAELREAIEQPAFRVGCEVERALTERLLADVKGQPGALPLLQFALTEIWKKRDTRRLTLRAYTELGEDDKGEQRGIEGVLDHRANEIYCNLQPEDQNLCRWLFLRLVQPGDGTQDTKRRVSYRELLSNDPTRAEAVKRLIRILADRDARLITTEGTEASEGSVEVAHEALIRGWIQLRRWVDAERAGLRTQRRLTDAALEWEAVPPEHKKDYLYSGARLAVALDWVEVHRGELSSVEAAFVAASEEAEWQRKRDEVEHEIKAITRHIKAVKDPSSQVRRAALQELAGKWSRDPRILPLLRAQAVEDADDEVRSAVISSLAVIHRQRLAQWERWLGGEGSEEDFQHLPQAPVGFPVLKVRKVRLRNIKTFIDTKDVDFTQPGADQPRAWTLLLGPNAAGKSTFLKCVALAANGSSVANELERRAASYLRVGAAKGYIEVLFSLQLDPEATATETGSVLVGLEIREGETGFRSMGAAELTLDKSNAAERLSILRRQSNLHFGLVCGYGAMRGLVDDPAGLVRESGKVAIDRVASLFWAYAPLIDPDVLGKMLAGDLSNFRNAPPRLNPAIQQKMAQQLRDLLPGVGEFSPDAPSRILLNGTHIPLRDLSAGYSSLLALVGHLLHHALVITDWRGNPAEVFGLVLLDDVDLHLHPSWQRWATHDLQKVFKNVQFIATTHSPMVAGGVPDESLLVLQEDNCDGMKLHADLPSIKGWRADQILTSDVFGLRTSRDIETEKLFTSYADLLNARGPEDPQVRELGKQIARFTGRDGEGVIDTHTYRLLQELLRQRFELLDPESRKLVLAKAGLILSAEQ